MHMYTSWTISIMQFLFWMFLFDISRHFANDILIILLYWSCECSGALLLFDVERLSDIWNLTLEAILCFLSHDANNWNKVSTSSTSHTHTDVQSRIIKSVEPCCWPECLCVTYSCMCIFVYVYTCLVWTWYCMLLLVSIFVFFSMFPMYVRVCDLQVHGSWSPRKGNISLGPWTHSKRVCVCKSESCFKCKSPAPLQTIQPSIKAACKISAPCGSIYKTGTPNRAGGERGPST